MKNALKLWAYRQHPVGVDVVHLDLLQLALYAVPRHGVDQVVRSGRGALNEHAVVRADGLHRLVGSDSLGLAILYRLKRLVQTIRIRGVDVCSRVVERPFKRLKEGSSEYS